RSTSIHGFTLPSLTASIIMGAYSANSADTFNCAVSCQAPFFMAKRAQKVRKTLTCMSMAAPPAAKIAAAVSLSTVPLYRIMDIFCFVDGSWAVAPDMRLPSALAMFCRHFEGSRYPRGYPRDERPRGLGDLSPSFN